MLDNIGYPACRPLPHNLAMEEPEFGGALVPKAKPERWGEGPS